MTTPPPPSANNNSALKTILIVSAIVLACAILCCCGGFFGLGWWGKNTAHKIGSGEKVTIAGVEINSDLPTDIPAYPGVTKTTSITNHNQQGGSIFSFETSDSSPKVRAFYQEKLAANGWTAGQSVNIEQGGHDAYRKASRTLVVQTVPVDGSTHVTLLEGTEEARDSASEPATEPASTEP